MNSSLADSDVMFNFVGSLGDKRELIITRKDNQGNSETFHSTSPVVNGKCDGCCFDACDECGVRSCSIPCDVEYVISDYCNMHNVIFEKVYIGD